MSAGAAVHSTSSTPGPDPLRTPVRPKRLWTELLYGAVRGDPLLPASTKLVAQALAWRADALRVDELFVSAQLLAELLERHFGRALGRGEAQRHLRRLEGLEPSRGRGRSFVNPYLVRAETGGGKTFDRVGEPVGRANCYRLGPGALSHAYRLNLPTQLESVGTAARSVDLPTQVESPTPEGVLVPRTPLRGVSKVSGSTAGLPRAGARAYEPDGLPGTPSADQAVPAARAAALPSAPGAPQSPGRSPDDQPGPNAPTDGPPGRRADPSDPEHAASREALIAECRAAAERAGAVVVRHKAEARARRAELDALLGPTSGPEWERKLVERGVLPPPPTPDQRLLALGLEPARGAWEPPGQRR